MLIIIIVLLLTLMSAGVYYYISSQPPASPTPPSPTPIPDLQGVPHDQELQRQIKEQEEELQRRIKLEKQKDAQLQMQRHKEQQEAKWINQINEINAERNKAKGMITQATQEYDNILQKNNTTINKAQVHITETERSNLEELEKRINDISAIEQSYQNAVNEITQMNQNNANAMTTLETVKSKLNEQCSQHSMCESGLYCHNNVCVNKKPENDSCKYNVECVSNNCQLHNNKCSGEQATLAGQFDPCLFDSHCESGMGCYNNKCDITSNKSICSDPQSRYHPDDPTKCIKSINNCETPFDTKIKLNGNYELLRKGKTEYTRIKNGDQVIDVKKLCPKKIIADRKLRTNDLQDNTLTAYYTEVTGDPGEVAPYNMCNTPLASDYYLFGAKVPNKCYIRTENNMFDIPKCVTRPVTGRKKKGNVTQPPQPEVTLPLTGYQGYLPNDEALYTSSSIFDQNKHNHFTVNKWCPTRIIIPSNVTDNEWYGYPRKKIGEYEAVLQPNTEDDYKVMSIYRPNYCDTFGKKIEGNNHPQEVLDNPNDWCIVDNENECLPMQIGIKNKEGKSASTPPKNRYVSRNGELVESGVTWCPTAGYFISAANQWTQYKPGEEDQVQADVYIDEYPDPNLPLPKPMYGSKIKIIN